MHSRCYMNKHRYAMSLKNTSEQFQTCLVHCGFITEHLTKRFHKPEVLLTAVILLLVKAKIVNWTQRRCRAFKT